MIIRLLLLAILGLAVTVLGHRIEIDPGEKQCFFETLQPQDKVSTSTLVTQSGMERVSASERARLSERSKKQGAGRMSPRWSAEQKELLGILGNEAQADD
jgi:hypothetical protein